MAYMAEHKFGVAEWPEANTLNRSISVRIGGGIGGSIGGSGGGGGGVEGADDVSTRVSVAAEGMCAEVRRRSGPGGLWSYPNSGVFAGSVRALRLHFERLRRLVLSGHFEDQAIFHLAMLQHPRHAVLLDANASLFASQFAYDASWWQRPACFDDYFDPQSAGPPALWKTGAPPPFALHFNGPAGRHRLGWCMAAVLSASTRTRAGPSPGVARQYYVDVDGGGERVLLPTYCSPSLDEVAAGGGGGGGGASGARGRAGRMKGAAPPAGRRAVRPTPCDGSDAMTAIECINDRCVHL